MKLASELVRTSLERVGAGKKRATYMRGRVIHSITGEVLASFEMPITSREFNEEMAARERLVALRLEFADDSLHITGPEYLEMLRAHQARG